jgi:hypothetical protein
MLRIQTLNTPHKFHAVGGRHSFHPPASNCGQLFPKGYVDNRDEPRTKLGGSNSLPSGWSNRLSSKAAAEEQAGGVPSGVR